MTVQLDHTIVPSRNKVAAAKLLGELLSGHRPFENDSPTAEAASPVNSPVPSIRDGKANGFKIYAVRPSSLWAHIGLTNGDSVEAVNGMNLSTPDKALEIYAKLKTASNLDVSIMRRGMPLHMIYRITK